MTVHLDTVGGLMLFSMIVNPAAAAYQFTYRIGRLFVLAALLGILSAGTGIIFSSFFNLPTGACVVISSSVVFGLAFLFSPKRRHAGHGTAF